MLLLLPNKEVYVVEAIFHGERERNSPPPLNSHASFIFGSRGYAAYGKKYIRGFEEGGLQIPSWNLCVLLGSLENAKCLPRISSLFCYCGAIAFN